MSIRFVRHIKRMIQLLNSWVTSYAQMLTVYTRDGHGLDYTVEVDQERSLHSVDAQLYIPVIARSQNGIWSRSASALDSALDLARNYLHVPP